VCITYFLSFSVFVAILQVIQCFCLIFSRFSNFLPYSRSYSVCFSFCKFFSFSHHISYPTMWVSLFHRLSVFSPYSKSYSVCASFCRFFSVSRHVPGATMRIFHFPFWSVYSPYSRCYKCAFLIYKDFQVFLFVCFVFCFCHIPGPTVYVSHFARFSLFPAIFQVLPCEFLIFLFGHFFHHNPGPPIVCIPYFPSFSVFFFLPYFKS
jgi:hypothetical protein